VLFKNHSASIEIKTLMMVVVVMMMMMMMMMMISTVYQVAECT